MPDWRDLFNFAGGLPPAANENLPRDDPNVPRNPPANVLQMNPLETALQQPYSLGSMFRRTAPGAMRQSTFPPEANQNIPEASLPQPSAQERMDANWTKALRRRNLPGTLGPGGQVIHELPNGYSIGRLPMGDSPFSANHVLISPQGGASLYGTSPRDLIIRGFPWHDQRPLLESISKQIDPDPYQDALFEQQFKNLGAGDAESPLSLVKPGETAEHFSGYVNPNTGERMTEDEYDKTYGNPDWKPWETDPTWPGYTGPKKPPDDENGGK